MSRAVPVRALDGCRATLGAVLEYRSNSFAPCRTSRWTVWREDGALSNLLGLGEACRGHRCNGICHRDYLAQRNWSGFWKKAG